MFCSSDLLCECSPKKLQQPLGSVSLVLLPGLEICIALDLDCSLLVTPVLSVSLVVLSLLYQGNCNCLD